MRINCFRAAAAQAGDDDDDAAAAEAIQRPRLSSTASGPKPTMARAHTIKGIKRTHRNSSAVSNLSVASWTSNESISRLPPCRRDSEYDAKLDALMMPVPRDSRPSRPLRLSHPKTYSALVADMKACKGTRDWRSFAVFDDDDVDPTLSADAHAVGKIQDTRRKLEHFNMSL